MVRPYLSSDSQVEGRGGGGDVDSSLARRADSSGMRLGLRRAGPSGEVMVGAAMEGERRWRAELRGQVEGGLPCSGTMRLHGRPPENQKRQLDGGQLVRGRRG